VGARSKTRRPNRYGPAIHRSLRGGRGFADEAGYRIAHRRPRPGR